MQYAVKIIYLDGKDVSVLLEEKQVPDFLEALKKNKPYWEEKREAAFWTAEKQVRFINIQKVAEEKDGEKVIAGEPKRVVEGSTPDAGTADESV